MRNQITRRLTTAAVTATLLLGAGSALMAAPALAQTTFTQGTSLFSLPSGATGTSGSFNFESTSCGAVGSCYSVGEYEVIGAGGSGDAVVLPITNGIPGNEVEAPLPAGAPTGADQDAVLNSVSCWSAASCIAVGYYNASVGNEEGLVVPITNGVVGTGIEVSLPSNTDYAADLDAVSCWSAGSCVAVGYYFNSSIAMRTWTVPITNGVVGSAASVSLPVNASSSASADSQLKDVSCASTGSCVAVGDYTDTHGDLEALVVPYSNGTPSAGLEVSEPANAASLGSQDAQLQYVDCPSAEACTAIGTYDQPGSDGQPLEDQITNGTPAAGAGISLPTNAAGGDTDVALTGLSCASAGSCVAVGDYETTTSSNFAALALTITNGAGAASAVTLPADADSSSQAAPLNSVSCVPSGPCVAAGYYENKLGQYEAMTVPITGASVGNAIMAPAPANESTSPPFAALYTIGCAASGSCAAVGAEENTSGSFQPYVLSLESPLSIGTTSLSAGALGTSYQSTALSASGGWGAYSWSISSGSLPAGLSLNAQTGVISGTPTAAGDASFTVQVSAAGVPTKTATQSLTINVPAPAVVVKAVVMKAPDLAVLGGALKAESNRVEVSLSCTGATCAGPVKLETTETIVVKHGKNLVRKHTTVVIGSASYSITAGTSAETRVTLQGPGQKLLEAAKDHRVSVTVLASATGGNLVTRRTTLTETVKRKTKKKRKKRSALIAARALGAQASFIEGTSLAALPSGAAADGGATFVSTSCGSPGSCYSVGDYGDILDGEQAVVLPITNGAPGGEVEVPLPAGAATGSSQYAMLNSVSCWSASSCIAVGHYDNSADNSQAMVVPITDGVVGTGIKVPLPSNTDTDPELEAVSCWSAGSCVAVGNYTNSSGASRTWTVPITNGAVGSGASVSLPGNANTSSSGSTDSELDDVSCAAVGSCVAVGSYFDTRGDREALVVPYSGGVPSAGLEVSEPANAAAVGAQFAQLNDVDCPSAGICTAIGTYDEPGSDLQPLEAQISSGTPGGGVGISLPANAQGGSADTSIEGLSCASAGSCVAVGYYTTTNSADDALAVTITNGGGAASAVTLPEDADSSSQAAILDGVSCVPSGPCVAAGYYENKLGQYEGMTVPISGTSVGNAMTAPAPSTSTPIAELYTISCAASGSCAAIGVQENTSGAYPPYVLSLEAPLAIGTASLSAGALGAVYPSATLSASGGWGTYSWSISSGSLPAGLSLNAQTGVISGTPTAAGDASFTVQVSAAGVPTQTATQSLTINVPARTTSTPSASEQILLAPAVSEAPGALQAKTNRVTVGLSCLNATCSGPIKLEVTETLTVKHGKKQVHKHQTVVIGSASYSLAAGKSEDIGVTLNALGRKLLNAARHHRLSVTVLASATGGNLVTRTSALTETVKRKRTKKKR